MRVWYDTEFWEQGSQEPILPISYGFVREDGQELYLIEENLELLTAVANQHDWLRDNVLPHLPIQVDKLPSGGWRVDWDEAHPDIDAVVPAGRIRHMVEGFLTSVPDVELWGWYSAYDHVVLAQTFGTMAEMPDGLPYWTNDLRQAIPRSVRVPVQKGNEHDALADARWNRDVHLWWDNRFRHEPLTWPDQAVLGSDVGGSVVQVRNVDGDVTL